MKTEQELNELKGRIDRLCGELKTLTPDEMEYVSGGEYSGPCYPYIIRKDKGEFVKDTSKAYPGPRFPY